MYCIAINKIPCNENYEGLGKPRNRNNGVESFEKIPTSVALLTYMGWAIVILVGYVQSFLMNLVPSMYPNNREKNREVNHQSLFRSICCDINFKILLANQLRFQSSFYCRDMPHCTAVSSPSSTETFAARSATA